MPDNRPHCSLFGDPHDHAYCTDPNGTAQGPTPAFWSGDDVISLLSLPSPAIEYTPNLESPERIIWASPQSLHSFNSLQGDSPSTPAYHDLSPGDIFPYSPPESASLSVKEVKNHNNTRSPHSLNTDSGSSTTDNESSQQAYSGSDISNSLSILAQYASSPGNSFDLSPLPSPSLPAMEESQKPTIETVNELTSRRGVTNLSINTTIIPHNPSTNEPFGESKRQHGRHLTLEASTKSTITSSRSHPNLPPPTPLQPATSARGPPTSPNTSNFAQGLSSKQAQTQRKHASMIAENMTSAAEYPPHQAQTPSPTGSITSATHLHQLPQPSERPPRYNPLTTLPEPAIRFARSATWVDTTDAPFGTLEPRAEFQNLVQQVLTYKVLQDDNEKIASRLRSRGWPKMNSNMVHCIVKAYGEDVVVDEHGIAMPREREEVAE